MISFSESVASENPPNFIKRDVVLFYKVPDQILMCQTKSEDITKGSVEFEKILKKYYKKRFNIISIQRTNIEYEKDEIYNSEDKKRLFEIAKDSQPIIVEIQLIGNGETVDTYQDVYGAKQSVIVPTTKIFYSETFGYKPDNMFFGWRNVLEYKVPTLSLFGEIFLAKGDYRAQTKVAINAIIKEVNIFDPPNKFTDPVAYNLYLLKYKGDAASISKFVNSKNVQLEESAKKENTEKVNNI